MSCETHGYYGSDECPRCKNIRGAGTVRVDNECAAHGRENCDICRGVTDARRKFRR